ncbi:MAG: hypothetical protein PHQ52_05355 [Candidatus Omnitrophica bacterium]|nr:hypothetical protein [Candidatus Omnitrophota bacterium]
MNDTFFITILLIFIGTFVGTFLKSRSKDRCLKDFCCFPVTLVKKDGIKITGRLSLESSAMEIIFEKKPLAIDGKYSVINHLIYKREYSDIAYIIRFIDSLSEEQKKLRNVSLKRTIKPKLFSRIGRHTRNVFATIRDSVMEVVSLVMGRVKTMGAMGKVLSGQDKYVSQLQGEVAGAFGFAYEAILERYIGKEVVFFLQNDSKGPSYKGVLKEYTAEYLELLDVDHLKEEGENVKADIIVPRSLAVVRHAAVCL